LVLLKNEKQGLPLAKDTQPFSSWARGNDIGMNVRRMDDFLARCDGELVPGRRS